MQVNSSSKDRKTRILIFVVAYEAESTLETVLARVPDSVFAHDTEVLVIDDSSRTARSTSACAPRRQPAPGDSALQPREPGLRRKPEARVPVRHPPRLRHRRAAPRRRAVRAGVPSRCCSRRSSTEPPTRCWVRACSIAGAARQGGMPLYKFVGNKILTLLQNRLLGSHCRSSTPAIRAYRVAALQKIPFEHNTNDFHFDTEIIIQLLRAGSASRRCRSRRTTATRSAASNGLKYASVSGRPPSRSRAAPAEHFLRSPVRHRRRHERALRPEARIPSSHTTALDAVPPARVCSTSAAAGDFDEHLALRAAE